MGGYLSGDNLVSMKNLNGFCGESTVKFNLFLICYSRCEKEKNWMSDGLKLSLSLWCVPHGPGPRSPSPSRRPHPAPPPSESPVTLNQRTENLWGGCQSRGERRLHRSLAWVIYGFILP